MFFVGLFGDLGGFVVADVGVQRGDQHEGVFEVSLNVHLVWFDAHNAMFTE